MVYEIPQTGTWGRVTTCKSQPAIILGSASVALTDRRGVCELTARARGQSPPRVRGMYPAIYIYIYMSIIFNVYKESLPKIYFFYIHISMKFINQICLIN